MLQNDGLTLIEIRFSQKGVSSLLCYLLQQILACEGIPLEPRLKFQGLFLFLDIHSEDSLETAGTKQDDHSVANKFRHPARGRCSLFTVNF